MDSCRQWLQRPIITLRIRDIQKIGCLSSYIPELLALTIYTDSGASLDTIANKRNYLKSAKTSWRIGMSGCSYNMIKSWPEPALRAAYDCISIFW